MHPDDILSDAALGAAVAALAERNRHHLEGMEPDERDHAVAHWHELAVAVLGAARSTLADDEAPVNGDHEESPGRAVIVLEDAGEDAITVHTSFFPELEDLGGGEVAATPAQAAALELLGRITGGEEPEPT